MEHTPHTSNTAPSHTVDASPRVPSHVQTEVFSRINNEGITPLPRLFFTSREWLLRIAVLLSVLAGALCFATALYYIVNLPWYVASLTHSTPIAFFFETLPVALFMWSIVLLALGYVLVRYLYRGYRIETSRKVLTTALAPVCVALTCLITGTFPALERLSSDTLALSVPLNDVSIRVFDKPDRGLIAGVVSDVAPDAGTFTVTTPSHVSHTLAVSGTDRIAGLIPRKDSVVRVVAPIILAQSPVATQSSTDMDANADASTRVQATTRERNAPEMGSEMSSSITSHEPDTTMRMAKDVPVRNDALDQRNKEAMATSNDAGYSATDSVMSVEGTISTSSHYRTACAFVTGTGTLADDDLSILKSCLNEYDE
jgi:hypothetical protein